MADSWRAASSGAVLWNPARNRPPTRIRTETSATQPAEVRSDDLYDESASFNRSKAGQIGCPPNRALYGDASNG
jgi:hypothetical protein